MLARHFPDARALPAPRRPGPRTREGPDGQRAPGVGGPGSGTNKHTMPSPGERNTMTKADKIFHSIALAAYYVVLLYL